MDLMTSYNVLRKWYSMSDNSIQMVTNSIEILLLFAIIMLIIISFTLITLAIIKANKEKAIAKIFEDSLKKFEFESDILSLKNGKVSYISPKSTKNSLLEFIKFIRKK